MESLGSKAADHVDTALSKAAKDDPQLAESAYVVWQALHEIDADKVAKHLAHLDRLTCTGPKTHEIRKYIMDFKETRAKIHKALEKGPLLDVHKITMAKSLMKRAPTWLSMQSSTILLS